MVRRITRRIQKLVKCMKRNGAFNEWYKESLTYYETHVFHRKALKVEMKIVYYRYIEGYGRRQIASLCRVSERYVQEFLEYMTSKDNFSIPTQEGNDGNSGISA